MNTNHFPDITRCKKLTEIGFPNTKLSWCGNSGREGELGTPEIYNVDISSPRRQKKFIAQCPSVMELLDVIPSLIAYDGDSKKPGFLLIKGSIWRKAPFSVAYMNEKAKCYAQPQCSGTLPNALCDLIFWLVENKYITF